MSSVPSCLLILTAAQKAAVSDQLSNNESSHDAELVEWFIENVGLTQEQADAAIGFREQFFRDPLFELFPQ